MPIVVDQSTPEPEIAAFVDEIKRAPRRRGELVALLAERHPLYGGRGANAAVRLRGYILAAFESTGLPDAALPYVLGELESSRDAYVVAGAAKALRGLGVAPDAVTRYLLKAVENVTYVDDVVTFDSYRPDWPLPDATTALAEIFRTLSWAGTAAASALPKLDRMRLDTNTFSEATRAVIAEAIDNIRGETHESEAAYSSAGCECCTDVSVGTAAPKVAVVTSCDCCTNVATGSVQSNAAVAHVRESIVPMSVVFEDQHGQRVTYGEFFGDRPSVATFFYTRCNNPNKCSLTITKLGRLQRAITDAGFQGRVRTAAITYDPAYDLPPRLQAYGQNRGVAFNHDNRAFRTTEGFEALREYFELGVNFGQALVNSHRIELFVLDSHARIADSFTRLQWDVAEVLERLIAQFPENVRRLVER